MAMRKSATSLFLRANEFTLTFIMLSTVQLKIQIHLQYPSESIQDSHLASALTKYSQKHVTDNKWMLLGGSDLSGHKGRSHLWPLLRRYLLHSIQDLIQTSAFVSQLWRNNLFQISLQ